MRYTYDDYLEMMKVLRSKTGFRPLIGAVLGSGLGDFVSKIHVEAMVKYTELPGLPHSTNPSHKGQYVFGTYEGIPVVFMQGRLHRYEGYSSEEVVAPIRLMGLMGIKKLILTNAAGGVSHKPGDLMMIDDHISCLIESPLRGENIPEFGTRFPDMSDPYDKKETDLIYQEGLRQGLPMKRGVYMQFNGPQFESKAEIRLAKTLGADAVGMSTAIDAIASNHMGIKTVGISLITNYACGLTEEKLSDEDVIRTAEKSAEDIQVLFDIALRTLAHDE